MGQIVLKEKEKKEINDRRKAQEKKIDHFERAKRKVEIPLLEKHISEKKVKDEDLWIESEKERDIMKNDFNTEDMVNKQIVLKEKEKKEINDRRKAQEKKIDHFERA